MRRLLRVLLRRQTSDETQGVVEANPDSIVRDRLFLAGRLVAAAAKVLFRMHHDQAHKLLRLVEQGGEPEHELRLNGLQNRIPCSQLSQDYIEFQPVFHLLLSKGEQHG